MDVKAEIVKIIAKPLKTGPCLQIYFPTHNQKSQTAINSFSVV